MPTLIAGIHRVDHGSREYRASLELRDRFLRRELGLELSAEDVAGEESQLHFVSVEAGRVNGCVIAKPQDLGEFRIRQMVVTEDRRRSGIGARLLAAAEKAIRRAGGRRVVLHSREAATGFYERCGYRRTTDVFFEVGIPHVTMEKAL